MEYMILGLLMLSGRTIYQLRQRIGKGLDLMYSSSTGSIQAALKKLMNNGHISSSEEENGRRRKIYCITEEGRRHFDEWINSPIDSVDMKIPALTKLYFMGLGDRSKRKSVIESNISLIEETLVPLRFICSEAEEMMTGSLPPEGRDIIFYQYASARFGRDLLEFTAEWYKKLITEMEEQL